MKIWFDTEFIDDGKTIELLSIGMIREDGETYYAEPEGVDKSKACDWVVLNVFPYLSGITKPRKQIANEIVNFAGSSPEFWGYFADYDWVIMCQLYGRMMDLPENWPMFCMDVQQLRMELGAIALPKQESIAHNALNDAIWTKEAWEHCYATMQRQNH